MVAAPVGHQCPTCVDEPGALAGPPPGRVRRTAHTHLFKLTPAVAGLIVINVVVYALTRSHPAWKLDYAQIPLYIAQRQPYRLLTAVFVHEDLSHLLFNMAALFIMGPPVEEALGRARFLALFLVSGVGGFVCSFCFGPVLGASLGASGAIFGVFGAWFSLARARRADTAAIVLLIAFLLAYSFYDTSIDWRAHVGGLITGVALGAAFAWTAQRLGGRSRWVVQVAAVAGLVAVFGVVVLVRSAQIRA